MANNVRWKKGPFLPSKNNRLVSVGQRNLQALEANNRQNVTNAVSATGFPITLYNTLRTGIPCTCQFVQQPPNQILDSEGKLSERDLIALTSTTVTGILPYGQAPPGKIVQDVLPTNRIVLNNTGRPAQDQDDVDFEQLINEWEEATDVSEIDHQLGSERLLSTQAKSCGICFGTGFEGGYELMHGTRLILTVQTQPEVSPGVTYDRFASPNAFEVPNQGGSISWYVTFPLGSQYALYPRVFNNTSTIPYNEWQLTDNLGNQLTPDYIPTLFTGKPVLLTLTFSGKQNVTHLELIMSGRPIDQPLKADSPEITDVTDVSRMDAKSNVSWILGGTYNLSRRAVVIDHLPRLSRHWRINDIAVRRDNFGFIYDQTCSSRLVDLYEITQLLRPVRYERAPLD
jgi:hypothetical protein